MSGITLSQKIELIKARIEIMKLKADSYNWQCRVPTDTRMQLEETLREIDEILRNNVSKNVKFEGEK